MYQISQSIIETYFKLVTAGTAEIYFPHYEMGII